MCANWNCTVGHWKCKDGRICIPETQVCDKRRICDDNSDEDPVMCTQWDCPIGG